MRATNRLAVIPSPCCLSCGKAFTPVAGLSTVVEKRRHARRAKPTTASHLASKSGEQGSQLSRSASHQARGDFLHACDFVAAIPAWRHQSSRQTLRGARLSAPAGRKALAIKYRHEPSPIDDSGKACKCSSNAAGSAWADTAGVKVQNCRECKTQLPINTISRSGGEIQMRCRLAPSVLEEKHRYSASRACQCRAAKVSNAHQIVPSQVIDTLSLSGTSSDATSI